MNRAFWRNKKVFITGHTGFKGSWLSLWLQRAGANVIGYSLAPFTSPAMFHAAKVQQGMVSIDGDVRDLESVAAAIAHYRPEVVIHMAAQALVKKAYKDPIETYTTNVIGTLNILEAVRRGTCAKVAIAITSDKCYENREWVWGYRENDRMGGHDPYSSSKGCAELVISAFRDSYLNPADFSDHGVLLASTRAGNVIGGGDWSPDRLVPDVVKSIMNGEPVLIRRPAATRPWQFVLEPLRGYLSLAEQLWEDRTDLVGPWNFGPDVDQIQPVSWIVNYLTEKWSEGATWKIDEGKHPHEDHFLKLDCTKAKSQLGWQPLLPLTSALDWIIDWYKAFSRNEDMHEVSLRQIESYERLIQ